MLDYEIHTTYERVARFYAVIFNPVTGETVHRTGNYPTERHADDAANAWIRCCELFVADATGPAT